MRDGAPREARVWLHHKLGHRVPVRVSVNPIRDREGTIIGAIETFSEDSALVAMRERIAELEERAMLDSLTGVPNRRFLELTLSSRLAEMRRHGAPFVVAFADVDHFKQVNDIYGHGVGDAVLRMIATTLDRKPARQRHARAHRRRGVRCCCSITRAWSRRSQAASGFGS